MNQDALGYERYEHLPHAEHIVYQGLEGTYSSLAVVQFFSQYPETGFSHVETFDTAMRAVDGGTGDYTVLPIENSTTGNVADSYGVLAKREISAVGEYLLPVRHALLACGDAALTDIRTVYSHLQSIKQRASFFEEHSEIEAVAVPNTTVAAQLVQAMGKSSAVAIALACAGQIYGLRVLIPTLSYRVKNITRFPIVGRERSYSCGAKTVSLMMKTHHEVGALYCVLGALYAEGISLLRPVVCPVPETS